MSEIEADWQMILAEAERRARMAGGEGGEVADYLRLRATNTAAREVGINWLLKAFRRAAEGLQRRGANLSVRGGGGNGGDAASEPASENHRFSVGAATMVGAKLVIEFGVRTLTIEAGFPRTPADGFVRGGGLAHANIKHFGDINSNQTLLLIQAAADAAPNWFIVSSNTNVRTPFVELNVAQHVARFMQFAA